MSEIEAGKASDLTPDMANPNKGTERGQYMLTESVQSLGLGRSIVTDRHGNIIAGNKTHAIAGSVGLDETLIVRTKGDRLVVVQREDLDLSAPSSSQEYQRAREMSIADNQSALTGISWDSGNFSDYVSEGIELDTWFLSDELEAILSDTPPVSDADGDDENEGDREPGSVDCKCPQCGHEFTRLL